MSLARTKRLLIALLAQVTLCLSLAPVVAAQVPSQKEGSKGSESPSGDGLTILAARDAANGRPEDVSETEQSQVRRVGRVSTRRFGRTEEKRRVETRPTAPAESCSKDRVARASTLARDANQQDTGKSTCPCHPRSDFDFAPISAPLVFAASPQQAKCPPLLFLGDCVQPTGPPAK